MKNNYTIHSLGENALSIVFSDKIDDFLHEKLLRLAQKIQENPFLGLEDVVPTYTTVSIFYDVLKVKKEHHEVKNVYEFVKENLSQLIDNEDVILEKEKNIVEIPVLYNGEDLDFVSTHCQLSKEEIVNIHSSTLYKVYMIGFLPGFPYLGGLDERLFVPRKSTPRKAVPKGSVGLAGRQTGIYPQKSPGGWQLIGTSPIAFFQKNPLPQSLLKVGDFVKFTVL